MAPTDDEHQAFLAALRLALEGTGKGQTWLAVEVAKEEGRDEPYSQAHVADWLRGRRMPSPQQVFALERGLGTRPGFLSRRLGYLPVSARSSVSVEAAISDDASLTEQHRQAVLTLYRALRDPDAGKER